MLKRFPIFEGSTQMRDDNGSANKSCDAHGFIDLFRCKTHLLALAQMVLHAVITPKNQ